MPKKVSRGDALATQKSGLFTQYISFIGYQRQTFHLSPPLPLLIKPEAEIKINSRM